MKLTFKLSAAFLFAGLMTLPALAGTTVSSPSNGTTVGSPFTLNMWADTCSSRPAIVVGYSMDDSPNTSAWADHQINGPVGAPAGNHTLHVKVWNDYGQICVTDVGITVGGPPAVSNAASSIAPADAVSVSDIQTLGNWQATSDVGTPGSASGWMGMTSSPSLGGHARQFATNFWNYGGERYSSHFGDDNSAQNFLYDGWVYIAGSSSGIANLEFDLNQTMPNGETVIMGFQCDGWSNTWDYTVNAGSPTSPQDKWLHSYAGCNPHNWGVNQWHHVQILFSHNSSGWVTYKSVWLDGNQQNLYITAFSSFALGWGKSLLTNFQVDGSNSSSGSSNVMLDHLTVYRW